MNKFHFFSIILLISAFLFFSLGAIYGKVELIFILFIPIIVGNGILPLCGFLLFFSSIILLMYEFIYSMKKSTDRAYQIEYKTPEKKVKSGGIILIGPIPITLGSNWKIKMILIIITTLFLFFILFLI